MESVLRWLSRPAVPAAPFITPFPDSAFRVPSGKADRILCLASAFTAGLDEQRCSRDLSKRPSLQIKPATQAVGERCAPQSKDFAFRVMSPSCDSPSAGERRELCQPRN
jgi:hypothetical protein